MDSESELLLDVQGSLGIISLNRPRVINSLSLDMLKGIGRALDRFQEDRQVKAVLLRSEGDRGLCAGGDVVALYRMLEQGRLEQGQEYFRTEYSLNARVAHYPKPYLAFMDGLVLGGGLGISSHGSHRIVTEKTRLAMPETIIGFSPDVGMLHLLSRAQRQLGTFLALTGSQVKAADAMALGLADYYVLSESLPKLQDELGQIREAADIAPLVRSYSCQPEASALEEEAHWIEEAFAGQDILAIQQRVAQQAAQGSNLANQALRALETNSPSAIKLSLAALRAAQELSLDQTLEQDFILICNSMTGHDLFEGIRAQVIDKDRKPSWQPASLAEVSQQDIAAFFTAPQGLRPLKLAAEDQTDKELEEIQDFLQALAVELKLDPAVITENIPQLLALTKQVAHQQVRPAAPLAVFLVGLAVGQHRAEPQQIIQTVQAFGAAWKQQGGRRGQA